jgi:hypothetical protein
MREGWIFPVAGRGKIGRAALSWPQAAQLPKRFVKFFAGSFGTSSRSS